MTRFIVLSALAFLCLGACTPDAQTGPGSTVGASSGPARSTGQPFSVNDRELETPNSLPPGFTTSNPIAPDTGVVGVTRSAPGF